MRSRPHHFDDAAMTVPTESDAMTTRTPTRPPIRVARVLARLFMIITALLASAAADGALGAQGIVRGVLHDSLRTSRPVVGAEILILGANRRTTTDQRGRFEFTDVAAGTATVAFWTPWLDSLALPPLQATANVRVGEISDVRLASPSRASYQRAVCGATFGPTDGILIGEVRGVDGSALPGVAVGARWHETLIGIGQAERRQRATLDTANASGFYALCGVPTDAEFVLVAGSDSVATGEIVLGLDGEPVMRRDLIAGPYTDVGRVTGRLIGPDSQPLAGATVAIAGDTSRYARTDGEGRFVFAEVPRRSTQFVARAIGFQPALRARDLLESESEIEDLMLEKVPQELSTVTVTGEPMSGAQLQFEQRAKTSNGFFISDSTLARMPVVNSTLVSSMMPRTATQQSRNGPMLMIRRGSGFCRPRFFIDGYDNGNISAEEEGSLMSRAKRIEVYTANTAPPQFNDFDGCGAVVVWTK